VTLHLPTLLLVCVAALATSAGVLTLFGATQRTYRGFWWWVAAQWLLTLGCALQLWRDAAPGLLPLANLLMLQWPIVVLAGIRRYCSRRALRVPASLDGLLLALAYLAWLAAWASQGSLAARVTVYAAGAALLHAYSALLIGRLDETRRSSALRALVAVLCVGALVQGLRVGLAPAEAAQRLLGEPVLLAAGLVTVASSLVMVYLALLLTNERTESNLRAVQRKLRYLADIDVLTRVPNRRRFHELAARTTAAAGADACALMMFDIDHFKHINDLLGHASGDEALRQVGRCVRDTLRTQDVAGRLGGDEFAVLLPQTTVDDAMAVAARIVARLADRQVAPNLAPVSLSFGIVQVGADEAIADALRRADQALYEAKRQGRSRVVTAWGDELEPVFGESRPLGLSAV
jgi:diguanylate cyclase (GGDEF)-like protein